MTNTIEEAEADANAALIATLTRERDYWKARAQRAEGETITAEGECDSLRVTLAATRAELDGLLVRMANESRMTMGPPLQKRLMGKEPV